jgi:hypothetical protein
MGRRDDRRPTALDKATVRAVMETGTAATSS